MVGMFNSFLRNHNNSVMIFSLLPFHRSQTKFMARFSYNYIVGFADRHVPQGVNIFQPTLKVTRMFCESQMLCVYVRIIGLYNVHTFTCTYLIKIVIVNIALQPWILIILIFLIFMKLYCSQAYILASFMYELIQKVAPKFRLACAIWLGNVRIDIEYFEFLNILNIRIDYEYL